MLTNEAVVQERIDEAVTGTLEQNTVHPAIKQPESPISDSPYTMQGVFNALLSFYQIKNLIVVDTGLKMPPSAFENYIKQITDVFNFQVFFDFRYHDICLLRELNAISKRLIRYFFFNLLMAAITVSLWLICCMYFAFKKHNKNIQKRSLIKMFLLKLEICYLRIITFGYKNVTNISLLLITCIQVNDQFILYIDGSVKCFQKQQYYVFAFIVLWVLPMPFSLYFAYRLYRDSLASFREMLVCMTIPPLTIVYLIIGKRRETRGRVQNDQHACQTRRSKRASTRGEFPGNSTCRRRIYSSRRPGK